MRKTVIFEKTIEKISFGKLFVIGVKPGRCFTMREDGKAVKMEFWAMEKEQENLLSFASLPVLNRLSAHAPVAQRKAQGVGESLSIYRNTTKPEESGDVTNAERAPVRQKASISDIYTLNGIQGIHSFLPAQGPFSNIVVTVILFSYFHFTTSL